MTDPRKPSTRDEDQTQGIDQMHHHLSEMLRTSLFYDLMASEREWHSRDEEDRRRRRKRARKR